MPMIGGISLVLLEMFELKLGKNTCKIHLHVGVSKNRGTPKSSILIGISIINHPFWGIPIFGNTHVSFAISEILFGPYGTENATCFGRCLATGTTYCSLKVTTTRDKRIPKWILTQSKQGHRYALKGNDGEQLKYLKAGKNKVNSRLYLIYNYCNMYRCHCGLQMCGEPQPVYFFVAP